MEVGWVWGGGMGGGGDRGGGVEVVVGGVGIG